MYSYVYFSRHSSQIHHWFYDENGKKKYEKVPAPLYFYTQNSEGEYKSITGQPLKKVEFDTYAKWRDAKEMFKSAGQELFEASVDPENRFILDTYSHREIKKPKLDVHFIDIEVHSESGFPEPEVAEHPITIITIYSTRHEKYIILTCIDFDRNFCVDGSDKPFLSDRDIVKIYKTEKEMLEGYIKFVNLTQPDIISGWNSSGWADKQYSSNGFDVPYIINRINVVMEDKDAAKALSPLKMINKMVMPQKNGKDRIIYEIIGITLIDYLDLYKKYHQGEQESFKLDYIAKVEIGETKVKFKGSLRDLFKNDPQLYCQYNIQDVSILKNLDNKLQFMDMMIGICYNCKCLFEQFSKTTRVLDGAFMSRLILEKIVLPDPQQITEEGQFVGAYVKEPIPGIYDWVISYDATSLYPSVMMQHNISPETKVMVAAPAAASIIMDALEGKEIDENELKYDSGVMGKNCKEVIELIKQNNYTIASNGAIYRHDKVGIVPKFVKEWFDNRKKHKKLMEEAIKAGNKEEAKLQKGLQHNYKILINSVYGALGSKYFRLYDRDNATAVTLTGQEIIKEAQGCLERFFSKWETTDLGKKLKAKNIETCPIIYGDTDSLYFNGGLVLKSFNYPNFNDPQKGKEFIETYLEKWMTKIIDGAMTSLMLKRMNAKENKIFFKREMIARKVAFLAKKRYSAWVLKLETEDVKPGSDHELETKGHEMIKSIIPESVRDMMHEFVLHLLKIGDKQSCDSLFKDMSKRFKEMPIESISKITSVNGMEKYCDANGNPISGCPGHVKAALGYNELVKRKGLTDVCELITDGDKVRLVQVNASQFYNFDSIAFKEELPEELGIKQYIAYDIMWEKLFVTPMSSFYDIQNWKFPNIEQDDISDLFA